MPTDCIPFKKTNYFSSLICDYLEEQPQLKPFYNRFPKLDNFKSQIEEKQNSYPSASRAVLVSALKAQYKNVDISGKTLQNIDDLADNNTFTITTGHQLNLFTGPLYFVYKIISTINLCETLKAAHPQNNFVPIYWMATEDHDFEEINFFNFQGKKVQWNRDASGAVGELDLEGLDDVFTVFSNQLNTSKNAETLKNLFKNAYLKHQNLAEAMRYLVNELFADFGLVILDGNDAALKQLFVPYMKDELVNKTAFKKVSETNLKLDAVDDAYKIQVNPREINLFYITKNLRERFVEKDGVYQVNNTKITWSETEILNELQKHPERFSPNVIMRPLFQEVILPNLCYIGGGGELAYWFQLQSNFETQNVTFPMLLLRNSVVVMTEKQSEKLEKLNLSVEDLFLKQNKLVVKMTKDLSEIDIDFSTQKTHLQEQFKALYELAEKTDQSFKGAVAAQEVKQIKGLENLEKRLLKAQKRNLKDVLDRAVFLQNELFPGQSLQERNANFSEVYMEFGDTLIHKLKTQLNPLQGEFLIIKL